jgi:LAO/AO transport system kinase
VIAELAGSVARGDPAALARSISLVEEGEGRGRDLLAALYPRTGGATILGVTGPPGVGKSSLVSRLVARYRSLGRRIGVVAVDPSSAFSGGAILGDRIRMQDHALDPDVFIRSMASRGRFGGLSRATRDAVDLIDASGRDPILIETVGVGQDEIDVVRAADTVLVVLTPGQGDDIQAIKAGILEIADLFVINKADHPGADRLASDLEAMLSLGESRPWRPPIIRTVATDGRGIEDLAAAIDRHARFAGEQSRRAERRRAGLVVRLVEILREMTLESLVGDGPGEADLAAQACRVEARQIDPYAAAREIMARPGAAGGGVELDHLGIAVRSLEERIALYRDLLGLPLSGVEEVPGEGVRVAFLPAGRTRIELLEPSSPQSAVGRFLEKRGEGIHHVCFEVEDLARALDRLKRAGLEVAGPGERPGAEGSRVAFLHPRGTGGVLLELRERRREGGAR